MRPKNGSKSILHIHTLDDPKDVVDYSAHQLLERAHALGFRVLAITLHDAVFGRPEVFADAAAMGILLIPAAEMRLHGADVIVLNVTAEEMAELKSFDDLRRLRAQRGDVNFYNCAASLLCVRRLDWIAITSRNRLLRRDRVLPFSHRPV